MIRCQKSRGPIGTSVALYCESLPFELTGNVRFLWNFVISRLNHTSCELASHEISQLNRICIRCRIIHTTAYRRGHGQDFCFDNNLYRFGFRFRCFFKPKVRSSRNTDRTCGKYDSSTTHPQFPSAETKVQRTKVVPLLTHAGSAIAGNRES